MKEFLKFTFAPWEGRSDEVRPTTWKLYCFLLVIPFTAIFHHVIFFRPTCMLNPFGKSYADIAVISKWLVNDPSIYCAALAFVFVFFLGKKSKLVISLSRSFFLAFLPLSFWIWDIPFTGRVICDNFHDDQIMIFGSVPLRTRYFYMLGVALGVVFTTKRLFKK